MGVFDNHFPLGLGTSHFPVSGPKDAAGIEKSAMLVNRALDKGVTYIDTALSYSAGAAPSILKAAFAQTKKPFAVTVKVMYGTEKTTDDARRVFDLHIKAMGLDRAAFFVCWTIASYDMFTLMTQKGGIYEGAVKLKKDGLIDHICFSSHAPLDDTIKIVESGAFEGMTLSYSLLNAAQTQSALDSALARNIDVAVMNPLGGGVIAQNAGFFAFARVNEAEKTTSAAMRFAKSHPSVKIVLSGVSSEHELDENIGTFTEPNPETDDNRFKRLMGNIREIKGFCTGCGYCAGCPAGIPVSELMRNRNKLLFDGGPVYNRTDPDIIKNINLFYSHRGEWIPEVPVNPCIRCGQCEKKCTQKLKIIDAISDTHDRAAKAGFSLSARRERLKELLFAKRYRKVGLYPSGGFADKVQSLYNDVFGKPEFEWLLFNSNPNTWGQPAGELIINSPDQISSLHPDIIVICTYKYAEDIYASLRHYKNEGIAIVKLHKDTDVPWVY